MKFYLNNLLNRLKNYGHQLNKKDLFIDKPWVLIDENNDYQKYIFKRDGKLIMSLNGQAQVGHWEFLNSSRSILIDRIKDKVLLNEFYFDKALLVLKKDGFNDCFFALANESLMPDLDIEKYLKTITHEKLNVRTGKLTTGKTLEIFLENNLSPGIGMAVTLEGEEIEYDIVKTEKTNTLFEIRNSEIVAISYEKKFRIKNGEILTIEQEDSEKPTVGDLAYIENRNAPNGKYKLGFMNYAHIENGVISNLSIF